MEEALIIKLLAKGGVALVAGLFGLLAALVETIRQANAKKDVKIEAGKTQIEVDLKHLGPRQADQIIEVLNNNAAAAGKKD